MSSNTVGYIYIRSHPSYDAYHACKLGKASNIPERDSQYATGEIERGFFSLILQVSKEKMAFIERLLQHRFEEHNIKRDAGTEFYDKCIIPLIEPYLTSLNISYKSLSTQEVRELLRCNRVKKTLNKIPISSLIENLRREARFQKITFIPRQYQKPIISKSCDYFQRNNKGLLLIPCGVGKTLISLWIASRLQTKTILIGVPNKLLLKQWEEVVSVFFRNFPILTVSGGVEGGDICHFLSANTKEGAIVITTYSSAYKVYGAALELAFQFDMKILDEAHHLTTNNIQMEKDAKKYAQMLHIPSTKQLALTATMKELEEDGDEGGGMSGVVSNRNIEYFGEVVERKSLLWAIQENIVCDYVIQTIMTKEEHLDSYFEQQLDDATPNDTDKRLFLSAFASLKSILEGHSHHLLIYANSKETSFKIIRFIHRLLNRNDEAENKVEREIFASQYHSEMTPKEQRHILNRFEKAKYGIISCVYCLGEGWDFPLLDAVVFAENMTSNIRIVQSALRASRKDIRDGGKKTKIILPVLEREDWMGDGNGNGNDDLKKVREVITQMGLEDETIVQKIKAYRMNLEWGDGCGDGWDERRKSGKGGGSGEIGIYDESLTEKLRLKTIKRVAFGMTYEKARKILVEKGLRSKEEYFAFCEKDVRFSKEPEIEYKGKFTNWVEFLGIPRIYYDLENCKRRVGELIRVNPQWKQLHLNMTKICEELCSLDNMFPPNGLWVDYYGVHDLQAIIEISYKKKKFIPL